MAAQVEEKLLDCLVGPSNIQHNREAFRKLLRMGHLDDRLIEIEVPEKKAAGGGGGNGFDGGNQFPMNEIILRFDKMMAGGRGKTEKREMMVRDCVPILTEMESEKLLNEDDIKRQALHLVEQEGIVFIDEIDKIVSHAPHNPTPVQPGRHSAHRPCRRSPCSRSAREASSADPRTRRPKACSATCFR